MIEGKLLYDKHKEPFSPLVAAATVSQTATGTLESVDGCLKLLYSKIAEITGDEEAASNILVKCAYHLSDKDKVADAKEFDWDVNQTEFLFPEEGKPYCWKRTVYSYIGASDDLNITYEIVASDTSVIIQNIYTVISDTINSTKLPPRIEYKLKEINGELIYLDESGKETTSNTGVPAYDYTRYWDGSSATSINDLPPVDEGYSESYAWTDYPQTISNVHREAYMSRRIRTGGKWGPFSTPALYALWPSIISE